MKIPYALTAAIDVPTRHLHMAYAIKQGFPRLGQTPIHPTDSISIACYGPSLKDTWQSLTRPIMSVSGALQFLAERGVIPDYHVDMDPREEKVQQLTPVIDGVDYLMASVCHPRVWDLLRGQKVTLWHGVSGKETLDFLKRYDPNQLLISGGSAVGLAAIQIGGLLGVRHFEIHGMDGSIRDGERHAGPHYGHKQGGIQWDAGGVTYQTSKIMSNAVAEMLNMIEQFPIFCVFHGEGLQQALVREKHYENACCADETEKAQRVRELIAHIYPMLSETEYKFWETLNGRLVGA